MNGPVAPGRWPLVVISHGSGGSNLSNRTLAAHLARHGFVVAMPEHPRDNRGDNQLAGTDAILAQRPADIRLVMDWAFSNDLFASSLQPDTAAIIGHSSGGYTALAVAGGQPNAFPWETPDQKPRRVDVVKDDRVRALVLLAPAAVWFLEAGSLSDVRIPILMFTGEKDEICEVPGIKKLPDGREIYMPAGHSAIINAGVPDRALVDHRVIGNAGHFSFISPYPEGMINPLLPPSQDPQGFDRVRFHESMNAEVLRFLKAVLL
jgi:predicted dienelactone hydrolase